MSTDKDKTADTGSNAQNMKQIAFSTQFLTNVIKKLCYEWMIIRSKRETFFQQQNDIKFWNAQKDWYQEKNEYSV